MPRISAIHVDSPVLVLSSLVSAAAAIGVGIAAGVRGRREAAVSPLARTGGSQRAAPGGSAALVVVEIALALSVATLAMLMGRTLLALQSVDLGFRPDGVLVARIALPGDAYQSADTQRVFFDRLLEAVRAMPGVASAGILSARPLDGIGPATPAIDPASPPTIAPPPVADVRVADAGALIALGMPIVTGRSFDARSRDAVPVPVIVTRDLCDRLWPGDSPLGRRLKLDMYDGLVGEIVGTVAPIHLLDARTPARPAVFLPASRFLDRQRDLVIRTTGDPGSMVPPLRTVVAGIDRTVPLYRAAALNDLLADTLAADRFTGALLIAFANAAVLLAAVGVFGVCAADVAERRREIAIRMALGSTGPRTIALLMTRVLRRALAGLAVGATLSTMAARSMSTVLFGVTPADPTSLGLVAVTVLIVAAATTFLPASAATRRAPLDVLRES